MYLNVNWSVHDRKRSFVEGALRAVGCGDVTAAPPPALCPLWVGVWLVRERLKQEGPWKARTRVSAPI